MFYRLEFDFASDTIMEYSPIIGAAEVHRTRNQNVQPKVVGNLDRSDDLRNTIVRLEFTFGGTTKNGTGFFVNLPSPTYDVILTAAHNLIDEKQTLASNMMVVYGENDRELATEFRICPDYVKFLETGSKSDDRGIYDYGVILLVKNQALQSKRQGMGLSLGLLHSDASQVPKDVRVSGYGEKAADRPLQSSGPLVRDGDQLEYLAPTEPGMSGSVVWIPYGGQPMVVGIHNMAPKKELRPGPKAGPTPGSRGARITDQVFSNLCLWAGVGFFNRRLCVPPKEPKEPKELKGKKGPKKVKEPKEPNAKPTHNTYLSFSENCDFAMVFLGSSKAAAAQDNLSFDILPATIPPSWSLKSSPLWAFKFHKPSGWRDKEKCWVEWQPSRQRAVLVDTLKEVNLVRFGEATLKGGEKRLLVVVPGHVESQNQVLRLYDDKRPEHDIEDGMTEYEGVLFADQGDKKAIGSRYFIIE